MRLAGALDRHLFDHHAALVVETTLGPVLCKSKSPAPAATRYPWSIRRSGRSRDTVGSPEGAGFAIERVRGFDLGPSWLVTKPTCWLALARSQAPRVIPCGGKASP